MNKERFAQRNVVAQTPKYWIRLTRLCNNNCIFCLDKECQDGAHIDLKRIKIQLKQGRKQGFKKLILSGGEPTLHPNYLDIVKFAANIGYQGIQTVTNGRMFAYRDFLEQALANGLTETTFSIHGHTKELYEKQVQVKGAYEQALAGLFNATQIGKLIVNIDIVINKINYQYLEKMVRFFIKLGVGEFDLLQVIPFGAAWENWRKIFYSPRKKLFYLHKVFMLQKEFSWVYLWTNRLPAAYLEGFEEMIQHPFKLKDEVRGRKNMLEEFVNNGKLLNCYGARCLYCFLKMFCEDLIEIKNQGSLGAKPYPICFKKEYSPREIFYWAKFNLDKFTDFFIEFRYFVKSLRCEKCCYNKMCYGMQLNHIREHGFKELKPIKVRLERR